jgi:uncharacterized protein (DUF427 family)
MNNYEKKIIIKMYQKCINMRLFGSVVAITFQSVFRAEMHQNNFFYFLKNYF